MGKSCSSNWMMTRKTYLTSFVTCAFLRWKDPFLYHLSSWVFDIHMHFFRRRYYPHLWYIHRLDANMLPPVWWNLGPQKLSSGCQDLITSKVSREMHLTHQLGHTFSMAFKHYENSRDYNANVPANLLQVQMLASSKNLWWQQQSLLPLTIQNSSTKISKISGTS